MFKDISRFDNIDDYLPIITAILIVDMIVMILSITNVISSKYIKIWYQKFFLSAVLADVLVIFIVVILARAIYYYIFDKFSITNFILVMLALQITHDILFYIIISIIPRGANKMIDIFQDYANEMSYGAIIGDSMMIIAIGLIASYLANFEANTNIIILIVFLYLLQFILYSF
jgi:hypothetical protein